MSNEEISRIKEMIEALPKGIISKKTINGKEYEYWQFREDGRQITKRVKGAELELLSEQIKERKRLEQLLKESSTALQERILIPESFFSDYSCMIKTGDELRNFAAPVCDYKKREIYDSLYNYIYGKVLDRVFVLYGLRRTGKTTMIRQILSDMSEEDLGCAAFIQVLQGDTLASLNSDMRKLMNRGFRYVFIDEVTLLDDFIEGAALFSDIYAAGGMKIVLSGTDSLGFVFSKSDQLYDRCIMLHTTYIPYREFDRVLGIKGIDEYIRYGGTMSLGGIDYNKENMTFATLSSTNEYIDSAIAKNIQHSLRNYQNEGHFRNLIDLYNAGEFTNAINRIVEDINHRFAIETVTDLFKSHDLGISRNNLRSDRSEPTDILDSIDTDSVTDRLKNMLEVKDKELQSVNVEDVHIKEIREYLELLDLIEYVDVVSMNGGKRRKRTIFTQPGLRYAQANALITALMQDEIFMSIGIKERMRISERILNEIRGRMMEDIILLESKHRESGKEVFVLQFPIGEYDMVIHDPDRISCSIYEIKHSTETDPRQYHNLLDNDKCLDTEKQYGDITGKYVIYRGDNCEIEGVHYRNVEEYLITS